MSVDALRQVAGCFRVLRVDDAFVLRPLCVRPRVTPASRRCDRAMDAAAPEEDFGRLPVAERLAHKVWKARVSAYEELAKVRRRSAPALMLLDLRCDRR